MAFICILASVSKFHLFNWTSTMAAGGPVASAHCSVFAACVSVCTYKCRSRCPVARTVRGHTANIKSTYHLPYHMAHTLTHSVHTAYTHWPLVNDITMWRLCTVKQPSNIAVCLHSHIFTVTKKAIKTQIHTVHTNKCFICMWASLHIFMPLLWKLWFVLAVATQHGGYTVQYW